MPLLTNAAFVAALGEARVDLTRARWTERLLDNAHGTLVNLATDARFDVAGNNEFNSLANSYLCVGGAPRIDPAHHNVLGTALTGGRLYGLLAQLAGFLDNPVAGRSIIGRYIEAQRAIAQNLDYDNPSPAMLDALYVDGPTDSIARLALRLYKDQFVHNLTELCLRLKADWVDIGRVFFPNEILVEVSRLKFFDSDPHKGGKRVMLVEFKTAPAVRPVAPPARCCWCCCFSRGGGRRHNALDAMRFQTRRLIYKPFDLEMDYRLVGDVATVRGRVTHPGNLPAVPNDRPFVRIVDPGLPVYKILPRNHGSSLAVDGAGNVTDLHTCYGYLEFLQHTPDYARSDGIGVPVQPTDADGNLISWSKAMPGLDWVTDQPADVEAYYRAMGMYGAMGVALLFGDTHQGNCIITRRRPHLIDLEICFKDLSQGFGSTGLQDCLAKNTDRHGGEFFNQLFFRKTGAFTSGEPCKAFFLNPTGSSLNANIQTHWLRVASGAFQEAVDALRTNQADVTNWLNAADTTLVRYTVEATASYYGRRDAILGGYILAPPPAAPAPGSAAAQAGYPFSDATLTAWENGKNIVSRWLGGDEVSRLRGWINERNNQAGPRRLAWVTHSVEHNLFDLLRCDIPAFYHQVASTELLNSRGRVVQVPDWQAGWALVPPVGETWYDVAIATLDGLRDRNAAEVERRWKQQYRVDHADADDPTVDNAWAVVRVAQLAPSLQANTQLRALVRADINGFQGHFFLQTSRAAANAMIVRLLDTVNHQFCDDQKRAIENLQLT